MVIVDTTVWVDYFRGVTNAETTWLNLAMGHQRIGLTDLILCEFLQGLREDALFASLQRDLRRFELFETGGIELAVAAAGNFRTLHQRGQTVRKTIDCLIATFCLLDGHALLHRDRDIDPFEQFLGLVVIHP